MMHSFIPDWQRRVARRLRHGPTRAEKALWQLLKELRRQRIAHFRRQAPVGPFIVDFVEFGARLVIEADGGQHGGPEDQRRDEWLKAQDFEVLRIWNNDILSNPEGVWQSISDALEACQTPTLTLPAGGREPAPRPEQCASPPPCGEGLGVGASHIDNPSRKTEQ